MYLIKDHVLLRCVTDYKSAKGVFSALKKQNPDLIAIELPADILSKVLSSKAYKKYLKNPNNRLGIMVYPTGYTPRNRKDIFADLKAAESKS